MKYYNWKPKTHQSSLSQDDALVVSPELRYVLCANLLPIAVCAGIPFVSRYVQHSMIMVGLNGLGILLLLYLVYALFAAKMRSWTITDSQLICRRGVFTTSVDYMELYRVNDYEERMSFIDNLIGIKTIRVHSSDQTNSLTTLFGIARDIDVVSVLRTNVEHAKTLRNVYEIANK